VLLDALPIAPDPVKELIDVLVRGFFTIVVEDGGMASKGELGASDESVGIGEAVDEARRGSGVGSGVEEAISDETREGVRHLGVIGEGGLS
jgi:hypothetical protein